MVMVRFTISGNRSYYGTTNGKAWYPITPEAATLLVEEGVPLELS